MFGSADVSMGLVSYVVLPTGIVMNSGDPRVSTIFTHFRLSGTMLVTDNAPRHYAIESDRRTTSGLRNLNIPNCPGELDICTIYLPTHHDEANILGYHKAYAISYHMKL